MVKAIVDAHDSGELASALKDGEAGFGKWLKALGKDQGRKGKRLFMPTRVALTGSMHVRPARHPRFYLSPFINLQYCLMLLCKICKGAGKLFCLFSAEGCSWQHQSCIIYLCRDLRSVVFWSCLRMKTAMSVIQAILSRLRIGFQSSETGCPTKLEVLV